MMEGVQFSDAQKAFSLKQGARWLAGGLISAARLESARRLISIGKSGTMGVADGDAAAQAT
jgi:hypothetical protein